MRAAVALLFLPAVTCFIPYHSMRLLKTPGSNIQRWNDMSGDSSKQPITDEAMNFGDSNSDTEDFNLFDSTQNDFNDRSSSMNQYENRNIQDNRCFVANLNYAVSDDDLRVLFEPYGEVIEAFHVNDKFDPSRKRGFGFVTMDTLENCHKAVDGLNGRQVEGRDMVVQISAPPESRPPRKFRSSDSEDGRKVYVGNLDFSTSDETLVEVFSQYGVVEHCHQARDRDDPTKKRGFAFITFQSRQGAEAAANNLNGIDVDGRQLRVNMAMPRTESRTPFF